MLGGSPIRNSMIADAARIATTTGAKLLAAQFNARVERGRGRYPIARLAYVMISRLLLYPERKISFLREQRRRFAIRLSR